MSKGTGSYRDTFDTIEKEFQSMRSRVQAQASELEKTRQEFAGFTNQILQVQNAFNSQSMEMHRQRHLAETSIQWIQKLLPMIPPEHKNRINMEMEKIERERMMPSHLGMGPPPFNGQPPHPSMNPAAMAAMMGQQHAAAMAMMQQQQAQAALQALQQQMHQQMQMGQAAQMQKMMMAAMGGGMPSPIPSNQSRPNTFNQQQQLLNPNSSSSPFATPCPLPPSGTVARSRKRSSPHTPRAGDTPDVPPNPSIHLSTSLPSASSSRSVSPSRLTPSTSSLIPPTSSSTSDPIQSMTAPSSSSSNSSASSIPISAPSPMSSSSLLPSSLNPSSAAAIAQMMAQQPQMASLLNNFLAQQSMVAPS